MNSITMRIFASLYHYLTSGYGWRTVRGVKGFHRGADYGTSGKNLPLYALEDGQVYSCGWDDSAGWYIWIWYPRLQKRFAYFHMQYTTQLKKGQAVQMGTFVGYTGTTGNSTGIHLHLGIRDAAGNYYDPEAYAKTYTLPSNGSATTKGVQKMKVVDVYSKITAAQTGDKAFNVQTFSAPDVTKVVGNHLADGRYWCNETGIKLAGLDGYEGAQIMVDGKAVYVAIIPGATEYTEMSAADAYARFVKSANKAGYSEAEMLAVKAQLDTANNKLVEAQTKIEAAQKALV